MIQMIVTSTNTFLKIISDPLKTVYRKEDISTFKS